MGRLSQLRNRASLAWSLGLQLPRQPHPPRGEPAPVPPALQLPLQHRYLGARGAGVTGGTCGLETSPGGPAHPPYTHTHACAHTHIGVPSPAVLRMHWASRASAAHSPGSRVAGTPWLPQQTSFPCLRPSRGHSRDVVCACRAAWHSQSSVARGGVKCPTPPTIETRARGSPCVGWLCQYQCFLSGWRQGAATVFWKVFPEVSSLIVVPWVEDRPCVLNVLFLTEMKSSL